jgi:hypothetical protein
MPARVFICYAGPNGLQIALRLRRYLSDNGLLPFLAGKGSSDIPAGEDFQIFIDDNLRNTHVMVTICDLHIMRSRYARKEIADAKEAGILNIPFLRNGRRRPEALKTTWMPVSFDPSNPDQSFPQLLTQIHSSLLFRMEKWFETLGTGPDSGLPTNVLREQRR